MVGLYTLLDNGSKVKNQNDNLVTVFDNNTSVPSNRPSVSVCNYSNCLTNQRTEICIVMFNDF